MDREKTVKFNVPQKSTRKKLFCPTNFSSRMYVSRLLNIFILEIFILLYFYLYLYIFFCFTEMQFNLGLILRMKSKKCQLWKLLRKNCIWSTQIKKRKSQLLVVYSILDWYIFNFVCLYSTMNCKKSIKMRLEISQYFHKH